MTGRLYAWAIRGTEILLIILMAAMTLMVFAEVVLRYVFLSPITWYDEFVGYMLVWVTFLGSVVALHRRRHIGFETVVEALPLIWQRAVTILVYLLIIVFQVVLIYYGWELTFELAGEMAITLPIPIGFVHVVLPVSGVLMLVICLVHIRDVLKGGEVSGVGPWNM
ncbi:MAG: TRAP transporter small permease [Candidatus Methylomirabilales bacterium]